MQDVYINECSLCDTITNNGFLLNPFCSVLLNSYCYTPKNIPFNLILLN